MGLFDFLKKNKDKASIDDSNVVESKLSSDELKENNDLFIEDSAQTLKKCEEPPKLVKSNHELPKVSLHDATWRKNPWPKEEPAFVRYRFDEVIRGGEVTKEYVPASKMFKDDSEGKLSEEELENVKAGIVYVDDEEEQHRSR